MLQQTIRFDDEAATANILIEVPAGRLRLTNARARLTNRTSNSLTEGRRLQVRDRMRQLRERAKKHRRDPLSYFDVPLPESVIHQLVAELKIKRADDVPVDDQTWRRMIGLAIATIVELAVRRKL
jgi:hypothetical protein